MSLTPSSMMPLGTHAPTFELEDVITGKSLSLDDIKSETATVVMFICNHCPYVKHIQQQIVDIANEYQARGIAFVAINANDIQSYPEDAPDKMKHIAETFNYPFPYLFDADQSVAKAYDAACTPDFFVFDRELACIYRGRFDGATPGNDVPVTGIELTDALDALLVGEAISADQKPSIGCNIKWKSA